VAVPNKTIYVSEGDLKLYQRAQQLAGGNLSAAISTALKGYVDIQEGLREGFDDVVVRVGVGTGKKVRFTGQLVGEPRIIFLDEPTTGLDPRSRRVMWDIVRELVSDGVTIFLTTQYLEEADRLASRIALLDAGRVVAQGTPAELKRLVPGGSVRLEFGDVADLERAAAALGSAASRDEQALALQVANDGGVHTLRALLERLDAARVEVDGLSVRSADLDDVFLSLTGRTDGHHDGVEAPTR